MNIDKGVPIPPTTTGRAPAKNRKYDFAGMAVGDSFYAEASQAAVLGSAIVWARRCLPVAKFTTRKDGEGTRIWRVK